MPTCKHRRATSKIYAFTEPVKPQQNKAAHGGICYVTTCPDCGKTRRENRNGQHVERGPWKYEELT